MGQQSSVEARAVRVIFAKAASTRPGLNPLCRSGLPGYGPGSEAIDRCMHIVMSRGIARIPHLSTFLSGYSDAIVGWGRRPSGQRARTTARMLRRKCLLLEDGFIRSVDRRGPTLSMLVDDLGVYFDANAPSRLEQTIKRDCDTAQAARARNAVALWREHAVSKYNHAPDYAGVLPTPYVLVVDQTFGDCSIKAGWARPGSFDAMLEAALVENPGHTVIVKVHPDVFTHGKRSHFSPDALNHPRVQVVASDVHAARLLRSAEQVYAVTSLMGFEALLWDRPVRCFGMPFYAGWGLTQDEQSPPVRRGSASFEQLVHAALIAAVRYVDPNSGKRWDFEQTVCFVGAALAARRAGRSRRLH